LKNFVRPPRPLSDSFADYHGRLSGDRPNDQSLCVFLCTAPSYSFEALDHAAAGLFSFGLRLVIFEAARVIERLELGHDPLERFGDVAVKLFENSFAPWEIGDLSKGGSSDVVFSLSAPTNDVSRSMNIFET
jgi:hypothetical protein